MFLKLDSYHIFSLLTDSLTVIVKIYTFLIDITFRILIFSSHF